MVFWHATAVLLTLLAVLYADERGLRWVRGRAHVLAPRKVATLHALVGVGLALILLTGGLMFVDRSSYLLSQTTFLVKMGFVGALVVNAFFIGSISKLASEKAFVELTSNERRKVFLSGAISSLGWLGAIMCGLTLSRF